MSAIWGGYDISVFINYNVLRLLITIVLYLNAGRRSCPGEPVAEWTSFLFMINILRTFKLRVIPGEKPPRTDMNVGVIAEPFPFKMAISKRK